MCCYIKYVALSINLNSLWLSSSLIACTCSSNPNVINDQYLKKNIYYLFFILTQQLIVKILFPCEQGWFNIIARALAAPAIYHYLMLYIIKHVR